MKFIRKLLWTIPLAALIITFLYGRKNIKQEIHQSAIQEIHQPIIQETPEADIVDEKDQCNEEIETSSVLTDDKTTEIPTSCCTPTPICDSCIEKSSSVLTKDAPPEIPTPCCTPVPIYNPCIEKPKEPSHTQGHAICKTDLPQAYNAPARIDVCSKTDIFVTSSFLYWRPYSDQLDLGIIRINSTSPTTIPIEFEVVKFSTEYDMGFKAGLGKHFNTDNWDLYALYTRYHNSMRTTFNTEGKINTNFYTPWFLNGANVYSLPNIDKTIQGFWKVDLDKIDLELARAYYVGTHLIFRPFIGGSYHWLDQKYKLDFLYNLTPRAVDLKTDSWSIGPRFGLGTNWFFFRNFSILAYGAISLMYSDNDTNGSGINATNLFRLNKYEKTILRDVEEISIGISWGSYTAKKKCHRFLSVSYEAQRYAHTNYMIKFSQMMNLDSNNNLSNNMIKPGDLFLHGLTLTARLDF